MDKLDAINIMLQTIGEIPIEVEDNQTLEEVIEGLFEGKLVTKTLEEVKKEVLTRGFRCNTSNNWKLQPDVTGYIPVPKTVLRMESTLPLIIKDWKLYDKVKQSFKFDKNQIVDIIWDLPFDDLPYQIAYYITIRASRKFQGRVIGDPTAYSFTFQDEQEALRDVRSIELNESNTHILGDGFSTRITNRNTNPTPLKI